MFHLTDFNLNKKKTDLKKMQEQNGFQRIQELLAEKQKKISLTCVTN